MSVDAVRTRSITLAPRDGSLTVSVVRFCRMLRSFGVKLHAGSALTALHVLREIEIGNRTDVRTALQLALVQRPEDLPLFHYLFNAFFRLDSREGPANEGLSNRPVDAKRLGRDVPDEDGDERRAGGFEPLGPALASAPADASDEGEERLVRAALRGARRAGEEERADALRGELERLADAFSDALATRPSRRLVRDPRGRLLDLRGLLRDSLRFGGVPVELRRKRRRVARARLLLFCDVSRSMDEYAAFFVEFAASMLRRAWQVELFLFASELQRVRELGPSPSYRELVGAAPACGGGTRIGACLDAFLRDYDASLVGSGTVAIVLSDGLDAGDPELLDVALARLRRRVHAVIWLNPLLRLEGYEPRARGMATALRYVDVFASAHDLDSLWELVRRIRATRATRRHGLARSPAGGPWRGAAA